MSHDIELVFTQPLEAMGVTGLLRRLLVLGAGFQRGTAGLLHHSGGGVRSCEGRGVPGHHLPSAPPEAGDRIGPHLRACRVSSPELLLMVQKILHSCQT